MQLLLLKILQVKIPLPSYDLSSMPILSQLVANMYYTTPMSLSKEWKLVQIQLEDSMNKAPSCLSTGKVLANFLVPHPADYQHKLINQR